MVIFEFNLVILEVCLADIERSLGGGRTQIGDLRKEFGTKLMLVMSNEFGLAIIKLCLVSLELCLAIIEVCLALLVLCWTILVGYFHLRNDFGDHENASWKA